MGYIFISYSRKQLYFAESVVLNLELAGFEIWFDLQKLSPGIDWSVALANGYSNCGKLILIASQAAIQSPYVQVEWETALKNGREVIVILAETVVLPAVLQECPVYDARNRFNHRIQNLIAHLQGKVPARHDPTPALGKFPYPLKMPFSIWLTLWVISMGFILQIVALIHIPTYSLSGIDKIGIDIFSKQVEIPISTDFAYALPYLLTLIPVYNMFYGDSVIRKFWDHRMRQKELMQSRIGLVINQFVASFLYVLFVLYPNGTLETSLIPTVYLIFLVPLISLIWALLVPGSSADILRWQTTGMAEQEVREKIASRVATGAKKQQTIDESQLDIRTVQYALYFDFADAYLAAYITDTLNLAGCQLIPKGQAETHLIIVTNRTSKQWLIDLNASLSGDIIHILATNINASTELRSALQKQWVDFRKGRQKTLAALADHLSGVDESNVAYATQVTPTGFDDKAAFPRWVSLVIQFIGLSGGMMFYFIAQKLFHVNVDSFFQGGWILVVFVLPLVIYLMMLLLRRVSLPILFHKVLGHRVAWFASPAPFAKDAVGNYDHLSLTALMKATFDVE